MTKIKYLVLLMCAVVFSVNAQETTDNNDVEEVLRSQEDPKSEIT